MWCCMLQNEFCWLILDNQWMSQLKTKWQKSVQGQLVLGSRSCSIFNISEFIDGRFKNKIMFVMNYVITEPLSWLYSIGNNSPAATVSTYTCWILHYKCIENS